MKKLLVLLLTLGLMLGLVVAADAADLSGCTLSLPSSMQAGADITILVTGANTPNIDHAVLSVYTTSSESGTPAYTSTFTGVTHTIPANTLPPRNEYYYFVLQLFDADDATPSVTLRGQKLVLISQPTVKPEISIAHTPVTGKELSISWNAVPHMDSYEVVVQYAPTATYSGTTFNATALTETSCVLPTYAFPTDDNYVIKVTAHCTGGFWTATSSSLNVNTLNPALALNVPSSVAVGAEFDITWEHADCAGRTMYIQLKDPSGSLLDYGDIPSTPACYTVEEGLVRTAGTYTFSLYCKTCSINSRIIKTFTATGEDMGKPTTIDVHLPSNFKIGDDLKITWTNIPKTEKYYVYLNDSLSIVYDNEYELKNGSSSYYKLRAGENTVKVTVATGQYKVSSPECILYAEAGPEIALTGIPEKHPQYEPLTFSWEPHPFAKYYRVYLVDGTWTLEQMVNLGSFEQLSASATSYTIPAAELLTPGDYRIVVRVVDNDNVARSQCDVAFKVDAPELKITDYTPFVDSANRTVSFTVKPYPKATELRISCPSISQDLTYPATDKAQTFTIDGLRGTVTVQALCPDGVLQTASFHVASMSHAKTPDIVVLEPGEKYDMWPHASKMKIYNIINSDIDWRMNTSSNAVELTRKGYIIARRPGKAVIHLDNWFSDKLDVVVYVGTKLKTIKISGPAVLASGTSATLKASFNPSNAVYKDVKWKIISGGNAATITAKGKITAKKVTKPTRVIVAVYTTDVSCTSACHVITIAPGATAVNVFDEEGAKLNGKTITIDMNNGIPTGTESILTRQASFEVLPASALQEVTWKTSNKKVAKVSANGKITAVGDGTATITATAKDGSGKKVTFKVKVVHKPYGLTVSGPNVVSAGQTITLKGKVTPTNATNKKVKWASSDETIATVDAAGVVTGVAEGTVTIICTASGNGNVTAEYTVTVLPQATYVDILDENGASLRGQTVVLDLNVKQKITLTASLLPENAAQAVTWKTSDKKIAKVSSNGVVTPVKEGKATITATAKDGSGKKATVTIKVTRLATGITVTGSKQVSVGQTVALTAKAADATLQKFTWTSDNPEVLTVNASGKITGVSVGLATITATTKDGTNLSASMTVAVIPAAESIQILDADGNVKNGKTIKLDLSKKQKAKLTFSILPEDALQKVTWKTSNAKVAKVSKAGVVTPVGVGKAVITVTAADGSGVIAKITIKVVK